MKRKTIKTEFITMLKDMSSEWKWLLRYIRPFRRGVILYILIGVLITLLGLGTSVASKYLIDAVIGYKRDVLALSASLVIGLAVIQILMNAVSSRFSSLVGTKIHKKLRSDLYNHMVFAEWENIQEFHSGDLINRLEGDISAVYNSVVSFLPNVITSTARFVGALCIVLYYDWVMAVIALIGSPVLAFSSRYMIKKIRKFSKESRELNSNIISFSTESLQNLQTVKAFNLTKEYALRFDELLNCYRNVKVSYDKFSLLMTMLLSFVGLLVSYSCYGWGIWRLWNGAITYGTMTLFLQLSGILTSSFSSLVSLAPSAINIATSAGRIKEITDISSEISNNSFETGNCPVSLNANDIYFSYKGATGNVISGASFYAEPGEIIGLVGPSGEGKTTLLRLLLGLIRPQKGRLYLEKSDGTQLEISSETRGYYAFVPQGGSLFSGSIADNLRMVKPEATEQELTDALKTADAYDFVSALPNGIHTVIGEKGVNFSEGQGQRLAIARAVLRNAPVLLLDESTSALDIETESRVLNQLMQHSQNRTCILTTHRLSMLRFCTRIYRISADGKTELITLSELSGSLSNTN